MLNEDEINALADIFQDRFDKANRKILEYIGSRLKEIGELTPSRARKIQQMYKYGEDLDTITQYLAEASGQSIDDIEALYEKVAEEGYDWSKPFYEAKGIKQIPFKENKDVQRIIKAMCAVTGKSLKNISRTTAIGVNTAGGFKPVGSFYKETIDSAITAVITGTDDYNSTIRRAVKELGSGGLKIQYESGYRRRLDSAVRQNVLDGVRYVTQEIAIKNGEEFGADGYEISAHSACAPDHLSYQGRQYSKKEYEAIQESLARPIGQWNCGHTAFPIVLGVSHRAYTDKELKAFEQNSNEKITIEGREYTRYECTQLQRKLETKLRYAREEKALYKAVGDKELVNGATERIRLLSNKYAEVSEKADLPMRADRTRSVTEELKRVVIDKKNDIIKENKMKANNDMAEMILLGKINTGNLEVEFGKIISDEIIVTFERINHIKERHPEDYALFEQFGKNAVENPDIIINDKKNVGTVFMIKKLENTNLNVVVRVVLETDNPKYKNSVMTFYRIRERNLKKLMEKNGIVYKKE